jgi:hypothetical protein
MVNGCQWARLSMLVRMDWGTNREIYTAKLVAGIQCGRKVLTLVLRLLQASQLCRALLRGGAPFRFSSRDISGR